MKHWLLVLIAGIVAIVGGVIALLNPLAATIFATTLAAWFFIIVGILLIVGAISNSGVNHRFWTGLLGVLAVLVGARILNAPILGAITLTWMVAVLFLAEGIVKIVLAVRSRGMSFFWPVLLSGLLSVVLAIMILNSFPESSVWVLGVLFAIELISTGVTLVALGLFGKQVEA